MAKKNTSSAAKKTSAAPSVSAPVVEVTPVRNSAVPPKSAAVAAAPVLAPAPAAKAKPTHSAIELRAYYIWRSSGGGEVENWLRAESELL